MEQAKKFEFQNNGKRYEIEVADFGTVVTCEDGTEHFYADEKEAIEYIRMGVI